jgi:hypothetical protein
MPALAFSMLSSPTDEGEDSGSAYTRIVVMPKHLIEKLFTMNVGNEPTFL